MAFLLQHETMIAGSRRTGAAEPELHSDEELLLAPTRVEEVAADAMDELRTRDPRLASRLDNALVKMPEVGQEFVGFKLVYELGRGAFGRVFLAQQIDLADRLVALKVAVDLNGESQRLAQLQHTNIVPIYSEHRAGDLHAFCMPFYGSTTLADVCKNLKPSQTIPTSGKQLVSTLCNRLTTVRTGHESASSNGSNAVINIDSNPSLNLAAPALATVPESLTKFEQMSYVDAVLWMASRLADGLAHAHERGIIHRDLKPANVLLCDDGQPMLLDFNLAEDVKRRSSLEVAQVGGTLPYMAPEQLIAFRDGAGEVDSRIDIYALGLVVYHLLTGRHAFTLRRGHAKTVLPLMIEDRLSAIPPLRQFNQAVTPAVEAIVRHCLEADPAKRYASARQLAEDLEAQRANLPLKHTPEPSYVERAGKWVRRNPKLASPTTLSFFAAAIVLGVVSLGVARSVEARKAEAAREADQRHERAMAVFHEFHADYSRSHDGLTSGDPLQVKDGLEQGEKALREYGVLDQADWLEQPMVKELPASERVRLKSEVGEIAFLMAQAVHETPAAGDAGKALQMNQVAEKNLEQNGAAAVMQQRAAFAGPKVTDADRQRVRQLLQDAAGLNLKARFLLGCEHAAEGRYNEALTIFADLCVIEPNEYGNHFMKARCHASLEQNADAIAEYGTAIALRPGNAQAYVARGILYYNDNRHYDQALQDLNQALRIQPDLMEAHINRALVLHALFQHKQALFDLDWALKRPDVPARLWFVRSRVRRSLGDLQGAESDRQTGLQTEPADPCSFTSRGAARMEKDPEGALADFIKAEELCPRYINAIQFQAFVLCNKLKKPEEALAVLDRLLKLAPDNLMALSYHAILLARLGKLDEGIAEARHLLQISTKAESSYRAACVFALASNKKPEMQTECFRALASALYRGMGKDLIDTDSDLDNVRKTPEFKQIVGINHVLNYWNTPQVPKNNRESQPGCSPTGL